MAEMIILLIIKSELCSWRNFQPDAGVSLWIVMTIKVPVHICCYLHMYRSHSCSAKRSHFVKTQPKICKAALKIAHLWTLMEKKLHKICRLFDLSFNGPTPFIHNQLFLPSSLLPSCPFLLSWNRPWESILCQALDKEQKVTAPKELQL